MNLLRKFLPWLALAAVVLAVSFGVGRVILNAQMGHDDGALGITRPTSADVLIFNQNRGCVISLPENPSEAEQRAAKLIQNTLVKASGLRLEDFPIQTHERWSKPVRLVRRSLGEGGSAGSTLYIEGSNHRRTGEPRLGEKVNWRVIDGRVEISSYPADAIEAAVAWFLEQNLGARWFMPGALGEHLPARQSLLLMAGNHSHSPSYISRNLGVSGETEPLEWGRQNRLRAWFHHGHAMNDLFSLKDLKQNPDFISVVSGAKYIPQTENEPNWQPNIAAVAAAEHAAAVLQRRREFSSAIGMNDSVRYDQSDRTRELLGELRWFRHRPDYSKLVFGFVNEVAKRVPGRYLGAYAYDWTEDTPGFPIERNVVPFLTADRSEWFDPAFAEQDKALIKRWVASGAEVVGLYDYYYGAPYLVPRPTLYAVSQSIPFAHQAGVRAFYAEVYANWGLDGPKAWLAAELLWDATARPEDLLETYYRDFWQEAGGPMREYFALCDQQWLNQPKPSYWIKYFKDEHQHLLFPADVRQKLQGLLAAAKAAATTDLTRRRVEFFTQAFAVTDAFCAWQEAKERLSRAALPQEPDQDAIKGAWRALNESEARLKLVHAKVAKESPLAVKATILGDYERNDPRRRAAMRLKAAKAEGGKLKAEDPEPTTNPTSIPEDWTSAFSFQVSGFPLRLSGIELLRDPALAQLQIRPPTGSMDLEWVMGGQWRGHGEPYETRRVSVEKPETGNLKPEGSGNISGLRSQVSGLSADPQVSGFRSQVSASLVMRGCKQETFSQLTTAEPGKWYAARVKVRGKVSPGNMTFLILNFQDEAGRALGLGVVDRLPVGTYGTTDNGQPTTDGEVELIVWAQAPAKAKWVGLGVRALNQVSDDYAAFSGFSLQALAP